MKSMLTFSFCIMLFICCSKSNTAVDDTLNNERIAIDAASGKLTGLWRLIRKIEKSSEKTQFGVVVSKVMPDGSVVDTLRDTTNYTNRSVEFTVDGKIINRESSVQTSSSTYRLRFNEGSVQISFEGANTSEKIATLTTTQFIHWEKYISSVNQNTVTTIITKYYAK